MSQESELAEIDVQAAMGKWAWLVRKLDRYRILAEKHVVGAEDVEDAEQAVAEQEFEVRRCEVKAKYIKQEKQMAKVFQVGPKKFGFAQKPKALASGFDFPTSQVGLSTWQGSDGKPVTIYYDPATGANGLSAAQFVVANINDVMAFNDWAFGKQGQGGNVIVAAVGGATNGTGGAYHYGCAFSDGGTWYEDVSPDTRMVLGLVEAEVSESYMGYVGQGWNCILPNQEIQGRLIGGSKARYAGEAVEITTASGRRLAVTANHPVLTLEGFAPAGRLKEGQNLLNYVGDDESPPVMNNEQHAPTVAAEVFRALEHVSGSVLAFDKARCLPLDLHGDATFFNGKVKVVGSYCHLWCDRISQTAQGFSQDGFHRGDVQHFALSGCSSGRKNVRRIPLASPSDMGGIGLLEPQVGAHSRPDTLSGIGERLSNLGSGHSGFGRFGNGLTHSRQVHDQVHSFGRASQIDTSIAEFGDEPLSASAVLARQLTERHAGQILTDEIVEIRKFHYDGLVYDFESPLGWIIANGLCISNCGGSGGEGLSRVMAEIVSGGPNGSLGAFASATAWPQAGYPDWVSKDQGTDGDYPSIGCSVLYLYWMMSQGYTLDKIVQAGEPDGTLSSNYAKLTGKPASGAYTALKTAVAALGTITGDNPFNAPLPAYPVSGTPVPPVPPVPPTPPPVPQPTNCLAWADKEFAGMIPLYRPQDQRIIRAVQKAFNAYATTHPINANNLELTVDPN